MFLIILLLWFLLIMILKPKDKFLFGIPLLLLVFLMILLATNHLGWAQNTAVIFYIIMFVNMAIKMFYVKN